jgi:hypothetical protein
MIKLIFQIMWHFIRRPDKILITIALPLIMLITGNYEQNLFEYKKFMLDKY